MGPEDRRGLALAGIGILLLSLEWIALSAALPRAAALAQDARWGEAIRAGAIAARTIASIAVEGASRMPGSVLVVRATPGPETPVMGAVMPRCCSIRAMASGFACESPKPIEPADAAHHQDHQPRIPAFISTI